MEKVISIILALYNAVRSTILGIQEIKRRRPEIRVSAAHGYVFDVGIPSEPVIVIEAVNDGDGIVYLNSMGFLQEGDKRYAIYEPYPPGILPSDLDERRKLTTVFACRWYRDRLDPSIVIGVYFKDETGREWKKKVDKEERDFWEKSYGDGWLLEDNLPQKPMIMITKRDLP
jgi:hypothetical protein